MWGIFFLARDMIVGITMPFYTRYMLGVGILLVLPFAHLRTTFKESVKATFINLLPTLLGFVGAFADTVSYIRLFAVGMAGLALSSSFYDIVRDIGFGNPVAGFFSSLIIVCAHLFNMTLGLISVMVHGLRLNVLEFSGHIGMQWNGYEYNPFKKPEQKPTKTTVTTNNYTPYG
jgi:V/A-type H+-transporting ATPase subunit I